MKREKISLLASTAFIGAMTPAERMKGRYMRAPDGHPNDGGYAEFAASGEVETSAAESEIKEDKPKAKPRAPKPAKKREAVAEEGDEEGADGEEIEGFEDSEGDEAPEDTGDEDTEEDQPKPKKGAQERIRELNKRVRQRERELAATNERLANIERLLQGAAQNANPQNTIGDAPDPNDQAKYPLGHLDDRYVEDKLDWLASKKAAERADAVLHRQQENERNLLAQQEQKLLLDKVDDLSTRGSEQFDDFQEIVVEAGMRGDWRLEQPTFEAAHEAEYGAQILYDLANDPKEAKRVAALSPYQQISFVKDRNAEIAAKVKPRTKPGAGAPPVNQAKGANSRTRINPATDNLDDFEKAWAADAKAR